MGDEASVNVEVLPYIAGRVIARMPDAAPGLSEMEDLVGAVIDELAKCGERFTFERVDGQPLREDWDEATAYHVSSFDDWDEFIESDLEPAEYVLRRWICVAESSRSLPDNTPAQAEQLPL